MADVVAREGAYAPALWPHEVLNSLIVANRRSRLDDESVHQMIEDLRHLNVDVGHFSADLSSQLHLARTFRLSAYDAAYVDLALRKGAPLMTRDERLASAAAALGVLWRANR